MPDLPVIAIVSWKDAAQCWLINQQDYRAAYHILWDERQQYPGMRHKEDVAPEPRRRGRPPARSREDLPAFAPLGTIEEHGHAADVGDDAGQPDSEQLL